MYISIREQQWMGEEAGTDGERGRHRARLHRVFLHGDRELRPGDGATQLGWKSKAVFLYCCQIPKLPSQSYWNGPVNSGTHTNPWGRSNDYLQSLVCVTCSLMSDVMTCKCRKEYSHTWHLMASLRPGVIELHKTKTNIKHNLVHLIFRITVQRRHCTSQTRTSGSTSCWPWKCSTGTVRTSGCSTASASKSYPSHPRRNSHSKMQTVSKTLVSRVFLRIVVSEQFWRL